MTFPPLSKEPFSHSPRAGLPSEPIHPNHQIMKPRHILSILLALTGALHAQGPLTPPVGTPGPEMKSLQEIWDKIGGLETQVSALQSQNRQLEASLQNQKALTAAQAEQSGLVNPSWSTRQIYAGSVHSHSLSISPSGLAQVAALDGALKLITQSDGGWVVSVIDNTIGGTSGGNCSIQHHPLTGLPGIAYYNVSNGDLKYAEQGSGGWVITTVASAGDVGRGCDLAFSPDGNPLIAFFDVGQAKTMFAERISGSWVFTEIETNPTVASVTLPIDLECSANNTRAMVWIHHDGSFPSIRFSSCGNGAAWQNENNLGDYNISHVQPRSIRLTFTPTGRPLAMVASVASAGFHYWIYGVQNWTSLAPIVGGDNPNSADGAFDTLGRFHLALGRNSSDISPLDVERRTSIGTPAAQTRIHDEDDAAPFQSVMAIDPTGWPAVSYIDGLGNIRFATRNPNTP